MNEPSSSTPRTAPLSGGKAAFGLGAGLLIALALVLAVAIVDRQRRTRIEGWEEVTAVGDRTYFIPPSDSAAPAVLTWDAGVLRIATAEREKFRDTGMRKAGLDRATGVSVYAPLARPGKESRSGFYVKVAPGEYLPARPVEK